MFQLGLLAIITESLIHTLQYIKRFFLPTFWLAFIRVVFEENKIFLYEELYSIFKKSYYFTKRIFQSSLTKSQPFSSRFSPVQQPPLNKNFTLNHIQQEDTFKFCVSVSPSPGNISYRSLELNPLACSLIVSLFFFSFQNICTLHNSSKHTLGQYLVNNKGQVSLCTSSAFTPVYSV